MTMTGVGKKGEQEQGWDPVARNSPVGLHCIYPLGKITHIFT